MWWCVAWHGMKRRHLRAAGLLLGRNTRLLGLLLHARSEGSVLGKRSAVQVRTVASSNLEGKWERRDRENRVKPHSTEDNAHENPG